MTIKKVTSDHQARSLRQLEMHAFPRIGFRPIDEIKTAEIASCLEAIERDGVNETANRIKQIIQQVFRYAVRRGLIENTCKRQHSICPMIIRDAQTTDAAAICALLRESVTRLCVADHNNDSDILAKWLGNKTPETLATWINAPDSSILVAEESDVLLAVGGLLHSGEISLNYVHPDARWKGVSKRMVQKLEERAKALGLQECTLNSTGTAKDFYLALGYQHAAPAHAGLFGPLVYPMAKRLD